MADGFVVPRVGAVDGTEDADSSDHGKEDEREHATIIGSRYH